MPSLNLSVLIVSYRVRNFLAGCLRSIAANGFPGKMEVICVDNASGDGTVETLRPQFPNVCWIQNKKNVGFAPAVNQAACVAAGDYLLLLNPDGVLMEGSLERLVSFVEERPQVGIVGPQLLLSDGRAYSSMTRFPTALTILLYETRLNRLMPRSRVLYPYRAQLESGRPFPVDAVEGSCLLTRRALWNQVDGLDARYFFGVEELDYAWKIKRAGFEVWYHPEPAMIHHHSGSTGGERGGTLILLAVALGFQHFMRTHRPASFAVLRLPLLFVMVAKGMAAAVLRRTEQAVVFMEAAKALLGLRPPWIMQADKERWNR